MSAVLTTKEMSVYLKQAMDLEVSVYSQERAISDSQKYLSKTIPKYKGPSKPHYPKHKNIPVPEKPTVELINIEEKRETLKKGGHLVLGLALFLIIGGIGFIAIGSSQSVTFLIIFGILCLGLGGFVVYKNLQNPTKKRISEYEAENAKATVEYEDKMKQYEEEVRKYEIEKEQEEQRYNQEKEKAINKYNDKKAKAKKEYEKKSNAHAVATKAVNQMQTPLDETKATLEKLYELDIIFPKYRNLVAVSTMYEYFASGRVSELEGPNGAYNLYEAELRQNLIINKLDVIITQLEDIKANQYSLYMELQETNRTLSGIASDVSKIVSSTEKIVYNTSEIANNTQEIAEASHIIAFCSQITAKNTEAIKYIALVNG